MQSGLIQATTITTMESLFPALEQRCSFNPLSFFRDPVGILSAVATGKLGFVINTDTDGAVDGFEFNSRIFGDNAYLLALAGTFFAEFVDAGAGRLNYISILVSRQLVTDLSRVFRLIAGIWRLFSLVEVCRTEGSLILHRNWCLCSGEFLFN
jgi:hypothetical protein